MIWIHVSELAIDRMLAGELPPADADAMRDHAASCTRCGELLADALDVQRAFAVDRPSLDVPRPQRRHTIAIVSATTALAAGLLVGLSWPHAPESAVNAPALVRTKGKPAIGFYVKHGVDVRRGADRERVMPNDDIEFVTTTSVPVWFAALSDDAAGTRSVYASSQPVQPGPDRLVPAAITLDDTLGTEVVHGIFCPQYFDPHAIDPYAPPDTCTVDHFTLVKVAR
jgi:hypothetical protein